VTGVLRIPAITAQKCQYNGSTKDEIEEKEEDEEDRKTSSIATC
jgi:hypothetical protein